MCGVKFCTIGSQRGREEWGGRTGAEVGIGHLVGVKMHSPTAGHGCSFSFSTRASLLNQMKTLGFAFLAYVSYRVL